jgi:DNA-binding PucR family transcriptional regulator
MARSDLSMVDRLLGEPGRRPQQLALADPAEPTAGLIEGAVVLGVGIDGEGASELITAAADACVASVVLRRPTRALTNRLIKQAQSRNLALHWLSDDESWTALHQQLTERLSPPAVDPDDDLADLAQTIATLTGGLVTIEDTDARVLAYSRSSDEVDDLRRLSILGRSGPPEYLALLRTWGVYERLASSEEVVEIDEHPESGVRRRLAVGVFAGDRQLGTIWVQQGQQPFPSHAKQALLGAARVTASQLVPRRGTTRAALRAPDLEALLSGRASAIPSELGRAARKPCTVAVFTLDDAGTNLAARRLALDELASILTVHAAAYRRDALVTLLEDRVYILLPSLDSLGPVLPVLREAATAANRHLEPAVRGAVGPLVESVATAEESRRGADRALSLGRRGHLVSYDEARPELAIRTALGELTESSELLDPQLARLITEEPELADTLLQLLETGSDVARVARTVHVHVTTVRYRIRRATELAALDLDDPDVRLAAHLQLRAARLS